MLKFPEIIICHTEDHTQLQLVLKKICSACFEMEHCDKIEHERHPQRSCLTKHVKPSSLMFYS